MKESDCILGRKYRSAVNILASNCLYEVIKKNKTNCWVKLWDDGIDSGTIYKNVKYSDLK